MSLITLQTLRLAKQNFKFSAAHFLIFNATEAERLHGHNYQVTVDIDIPSDSSQDQGYFIDFNVFKKFIKARLDEWDEYTLFPQHHPEMNFRESGESLEIRFRDRFYVLPKKEVRLLPLTNTSVEQLSRLLAEEFLQEFKKHGVKSLCVCVEETKGQGASSHARLAQD